MVPGRAAWRAGRALVPAGRALAESREDGGKRREAGEAARGSLPGVQAIQELCVGLEVEP